MSPAKGKSSTTRKTSSKPKTKASKKKAGSSKGAADFFDPGVEVARELSAIAETHAVSELIYETDALTLTIRRGAVGASPMPQMIASHAPVQLASPTLAPAAAGAPGAAAPATAEADDNLHVVTSPFVGTFYRAPNPESPNYVEPGASVAKGDVLCIVEAMKLMNEIEADVSGTIAAILVKNAESVEYGQPLFKIEPA